MLSSNPRRVAQVPAGFRRIASVPVVFFPLVANRAHDDVVADDLDRCLARKLARDGEVLQTSQVRYRFLQQRDRVLGRHRPAR